MVDSTTFIDAQGIPIDTFSCVVVYWHIFESACPKHKPSNGSKKAVLLHDKIEVKAFA
jgi:hypothetical protein